jgi:hypothetical protein
MDRIRELAIPEFPFPEMRASHSSRILAFLGNEYELPPCQYCGAVKISSGFMRCCEGFEVAIAGHLPEPMQMEIRRAIEDSIRNGSANFPRLLNRDLRPVLQHAHVSSPNGAASTLFLRGIPHAVYSFRWFLTPVYAIFNALDGESTGSGDVRTRLIRTIREQNEILKNYISDRISNAVDSMRVRLVGSPDPGMNLAILNADGSSAESAEFQVLKSIYQLEKVAQWATQYDQFIYPLIFWNNKGGCGAKPGDTIQGSTKLIRKVLICLMLQPRDHFLHVLEILREEFLGSVSGRLINMHINWLFAAQRSYLAREDEIQGIDGAENGEKEFGLRSFIPSALTDTDQYWHGVAEKCFALSTRTPTSLEKSEDDLFVV